MPSRRPSHAIVSDPARSAAREIRRLSEALALARFDQLIDEAGGWVMWLGAAVPRARPAGRREGAALRQASRGFERWLDQNMGLLLVLGYELVRRAEVVRSAALVCLREAGRARGDLEAGRRALEASLLEMERALARSRAEIRAG
ncbi:MAG TPA: hypothetical protein VFI16_06165 [Anaeromyxobacteraceae bacterium]|nr:hypothetical protein [Anaeromyxobacteraceae bacterium]